MKAKKAVMFLVLGLFMSLVAMPAAFSRKKLRQHADCFARRSGPTRSFSVAENMQLTEAEAKAFWPVYEQYQNELFLLRTRTLKLINDFADAYEKMSDETAKKLLDEFMTIESFGSEAPSGLSPEVSQSFARSQGRAVSGSRTRSRLLCSMSLLQTFLS